MSGAERRERIIKKLQKSDKPVSGSAFARDLQVSRQVIVQDIALLRASGYEIMSANRGYILMQEDKSSRVFKVHHTEDEVEDELNLFVDYGGYVRDVFIYHKVYGLVRVPLNIRSRLEVGRYMDNIRSGQSRPLSGATSGYHYHTVEAESEEVLDLIQRKLDEVGFLTQLQDYEPVDFWGQKEQSAEPL